MRVLSEVPNHPTADDLVRLVRQVIPSISHATVYRNLQELVKAGLIGTLERAGASVQFETNPDSHHHFVCGACGGVWDVYLDAFQVQPSGESSILGFRVDRQEVQLHGRCARCAASEAQPTS